MQRELRKLGLTAHLAFSVGWFGAVVVFLVHAAIALTAENAAVVRGVYLVMEPAAWVVLVPLALGSLVTGIVQSLSTHWGLIRHYWVAVKLVITGVATAILLAYMKTFRAMAVVAGDESLDLALVRNPSPAVHAALAVIALLAATVLAVYKPWGLTPYGRAEKRGPRST